MFFGMYFKENRREYTELIKKERIRKNTTLLMSRQKEIFTKKTHESIENKIKKIYLLERFSYVNE